MSVHPRRNRSPRHPIPTFRPIQPRAVIARQKATARIPERLGRGAEALPEGAFSEHALVEKRCGAHAVSRKQGRHAKGRTGFWEKERVSLNRKTTLRNFREADPDAHCSGLRANGRTGCPDSLRIDRVSVKRDSAKKRTNRLTEIQKTRRPLSRHTTKSLQTQAGARKIGHPLFLQTDSVSTATRQRADTVPSRH